MKYKISLITKLFLLLSLLLSLALLINTIPFSISVNKPVKETVFNMLKPDTDEFQDDEASKLRVKPASTNYDSYLEAYYRNLTKNMGENYKGSCSYVAIGMILSYYDTYFNDNIIAEKYDVISSGSGTNMNERKISPGVFNDKLSNGSSCSNAEYLTTMRTMATRQENPSFHANLISMGADLGYYTASEKYPCGLTYSRILYLLTTYLSSVGYVQGVDYVIEASNATDSADIEDYIKEKIMLGYPVYTLASSSNGGHAFITYDIEDDEIYGNMGWSDSSNYAHYKVKNMFNTFNGAFVIDWKGYHSHSNNYDVSGTKYCYCSHNIITYKPTTHIYDYRYVSGADAHEAYCICGAHINSTHSFNVNLENTDTDNHTRYCVCGASIVEAHNFTCSYTQKNDSYHLAKCECGATKIQNHTWIPYSVPNPGIYTYAQCKYCLWVKKSSSIIGPVLPNI